jgi:heterotetrameric sarcosine oxidase gamma subunit
VRSGVGVCDVSTLGKIALLGPDAAAFLDRVYCNTFSTPPVGKARYGLMLREDGFVMDDGTTARLGEDEWVLSTTTVNAGKVMQHLAFCHQVLWPELDVQMVSVTEQWAQFAVAGPRSRELLERLFGAGTDLSNAAFPYLACGTFPLGPTRARLFRLSFSGELAYEIAVPAGYGDALVRALMEAGRDLGVTPYGTEALAVMRVEKGHVAGAELNGQTVARDLGLGRMMSKKKDYVGRLMAERAALNDPARPTLVGLKPTVAGVRLRAGAHFLPLGAAATAENDQGYMTSTAFSPTLGHWIGLGLLANGPQRMGEQIRAYDPVRGGDAVVEVVNPVFVDPDGLAAGLGLALPDGPRRVEAAGRSALGLAPDRWLIVGEGPGEALREAVAGAAGSLGLATDQTDARTVFRIAGEGLRPMMEKLVPIDLHPRAFAEDAAASTDLHGLSAILWRESGALLLAVPRSMEADAERLLEEARLSTTG